MKKSLLTLVLIVALITCLASCEWLFPTPGVQEHQHAFDKQVATDEYKASDATCLQPASYYYSCECGKKGTDTFTYGEAKGHSFASDWSRDDTHHWKEATCEHTAEKGEYAEHTLVPNEAGTEKSCVCGYSELIIEGLETPANIAYADRTLSFDAVTHAQKYTVSLLNGETVVATKEITETSLSIDEFGVSGLYTVKVTAHYMDIVSAAAELEVNILHLDSNAILEAEDALLNPAHRYEKSDCHGGGLALDFNNGGQGMYFRYYAYEAGEREVDVYYGTAFPGAFMFFYVNGNETPTKVLFPEETGWLTDNGGRSAKATVTLSLREGWNEIYLIKGQELVGDGVYDYGAYVQIDYIEIHGTDKEFDVSNLDMSSDYYRLEGEISAWNYVPRENIFPVACPWGEKFTMGYGMGNMDVEGDTLKFVFEVAETATYKIGMMYSGNHPDFDHHNINVIINGGDPQNVILTKTAAWDALQMGTLIESVELKAGQLITIELVRTDIWFVMDYITVTKTTHECEYVYELPFAQYLASTLSCTSDLAYYKSCVCGAHGEDKFVVTEAEGHSFADTYSMDSTHHWFASTCGHADEKKDYAEHTIVLNSEGTKLECFCSYSINVVTSLDKATNITITKGVLSWDAVEGASNYHVVVKAGETVVVDEVIVAATSIDLAAKGLVGDYTVAIVAEGKNIAGNTIESEPATEDITVFYIDGDVLMEAEDAAPAHRVEAPDTHGGAAAMNFNAGGEGMYFRYYAYEAGVKTIEVYYGTAMAPASMVFFVVGDTNTYTVNCTENNGWFGGSTTAAKATVEIPLKQGWNELYLLKHGTTDNNWGSYVQIDYIVVKGSGNEYDPATIDKSADNYHLKFVKGYGYASPYYWLNCNYSWDYGVGGIESTGSGALVNFTVQDAGKYQITVRCAGFNTSFNLTVNGGDPSTLSFVGVANHTVLNDVDCGTFEFEAGQNVTLDFGWVSSWMTLDYVTVTKVVD